MTGLDERQFLFEATAGEFSGNNVGCDNSRAAVLDSAASATLTLPSCGPVTIRAMYAGPLPINSGSLTVYVATELTLSDGVGCGDGGSGCAEDTDASGTVDVQDLLNVLSAYGGSGSDGTDTNGDATVDVNDLLDVLSSYGQECGSSSSSAPDCAMGDDCGGQEWTDCGSSCPSICGEAPAGFCVEMCNSGFFCPSALMWDGGAGACVAESDCSEVFELPPGAALGRPFMDASLRQALRPSAVNVASDWC